MENKGYGILDFEAIWNMARDLIFNILAEGMMLDAEGNFVGCPEDPVAFINSRDEDPRYKFLNFRECKELHDLTLADASELFSNEIKDKYLHDTLPLMRKVMRKGSLTPYQRVSENVPDDYLDQIICTAWKADLMIWCGSWDRGRKEEE